MCFLVEKQLFKSFALLLPGLFIVWVLKYFDFFINSIWVIPCGMKCCQRFVDGLFPFWWFFLLCRSCSVICNAIFQFLLLFPRLLESFKNILSYAYARSSPVLLQGSVRFSIKVLSPFWTDFVKGETQESTFIPLFVDVWFPWNHLLKRLSFL